MTPRKVLPGDRRIWAAAGVVLALLSVVLLVGLAEGREPFTGSNSVFPRDAIAEVPAGKELCISRVRIPSGTGRVRPTIDTRLSRQPEWTMTVRLWDTPQRRGTPEELVAVRRATEKAGLEDLDFVLPRDVPDAPGGYRMADVCIVSEAGGDPWFLWGRGPLGIADRPLRIEGRAPIAARAALRFLERSTEERSMLSQLPTVFERASLFRPGPVGPWTFWVVLFGVLPALCFAGVRLLAGAEDEDAEGRRRVPLVLAVGLCAFGVAASWAVMTPPFQAPDESEHFAAVQWFAETGKAVDAQPTDAKPTPWSTEEVVALDATRQQTTFERRDAQLPWLPSYELAYEARQYPGGKRLPQDDGGGFHPSTSTHTPLYYALASPAYLAVADRGPFTELLAMRLFDALLGAVVAMLAFLTIREMAPRRRALAVAGGLMVAFAPMVSFMAGAVNNDAGANVIGALLTYLCVRGLRRGLSWRLGAAIGVALAAAPLLKGTTYALYPAVALAVGFMLLKGRGVPKRALVSAGVLVVGFLAVYLGWDRLSSQFDRTSFATPGGGTPTDSVVGFQDPQGLISWWWQMFVPYTPPFLTDLTLVKWPLYDIYVREGFGAFGWYAIFFDEWIYHVVVAALLGLVVLGARLVREHRAALRARGPELAFLLLVPIAVLFAVEAAYYTVTDIPLDSTPEQGRYLFPAVCAIATMAALACLGAGRRRAPVLATVLVCGLMGMTVGGQFLQLQSFYT